MRFLTDAQASQRFIDLLRRLDWDVRTVYDEETEKEKHDYLHVQHARSLDRIFITFDHLRGVSGAEVARELASNGGKVVKVGGGPEQPPYRAVGKLLFHHDVWALFLRDNDGLVDISDIKKNPVCYPPNEYLQHVDPTGAQPFIQYLEQRREQRRRPHRRRVHQVPPREQAEMDLGTIREEGVSNR